MSVKTKSRQEHLQEIKDEWRALGKEWPTPARTIIRWAIETGRITETKQTVEDFWSRQMSAALREEIYTDPQGRRVRKNHSYIELVETPDGIKKQAYLWCDIVDAPPEKMDASKEHRINHMVHEGVKLQTDIDSYNDNNPYGVQLELDLSSIAERVEEAMLDDEYDPGIDRPEAE